MGHEKAMGFKTGCYTYIFDFDLLSMYGSGHSFLLGKVIHKWIVYSAWVPNIEVHTHTRIFICMYIYIIGTLEIIC